MLMFMPGYLPSWIGNIFSNTLYKVSPQFLSCGLQSRFNFCFWGVMAALQQHAKFYVWQHAHQCLTCSSLPLSFSPPSPSLPPWVLGCMNVNTVTGQHCWSYTEQMTPKWSPNEVGGAAAKHVYACVVWQDAWTILSSFITLTPCLKCWQHFQNRLVRYFRDFKIAFGLCSNFSPNFKVSANTQNSQNCVPKQFHYFENLCPVAGQSTPRDPCWKQLLSN